VQLLADSFEPGSYDAETVALMREATTFLGETLNDLLALQKIEEGDLELLMKPFLLEDLLCISLEPFQGLAYDMGVRFVTNMNENISTRVVGDKYRLQHVLSNLVSNAIKFSPTGSAVEIVVTADDWVTHGTTFAHKNRSSYTDNMREIESYKRYYISVRDSGCGISAEKLKTLFVPFLETRSGELQQGRGTGIGLAISKEIGTCESMRGRK